ncbi:MAG: hypothetical protein ACI9SJ_001735 [Flavobacteriaceae bacterium]|jgi:hypothetical protein|uniref:hypothetical protein n=1 Tax=Candidatus Marifrigoribacter sp. Uisw_064 TaxID=3230970 RepID=UPI003AEB2B47
MSNAFTISGSIYTVTGTVKNKDNNEGIEDLHVLVYDKDLLSDDFLGIGVTDASGTFSLSFDASKFKNIFDNSPELYFIVKDAGLELLNTKDQYIKNANEDTPPINLMVDIVNDKLRALINPKPVEGWVGGFEQSNPAFGYNPTPDLSSLDMLKNMANIDKLERQQKVVWPEFSWETEPGKDDPKRCYQMFAPDISRLGYTKEGRVYSIICPQQGAASPNFGSMNVEVTVTGNRGWADETTKELAADMSVVGKIWFSKSAQKKETVKVFANHFEKKGLPFPSSKAKAIVINTYNPANPSEKVFPLTRGSSTDFPIPDFAKHEGLSWSLGHLVVKIGAIEPSGFEIVDKFNQLMLDVFNIASGNMLKDGNTLTWNVWFTAPELVDQVEWLNHAKKWRESIDADHGSPEGPGTDARHFDGIPFKPLKELLINELPKIIAFTKEHL